MKNEGSRNRSRNTKKLKKRQALGIGKTIRGAKLTKKDGLYEIKRKLEKKKYKKKNSKKIKTYV